MREWHFQVWSFGKLRAEGICVHTDTYEQAIEKAKTFLYRGETLKFDEADQ